MDTLEKQYADLMDEYLRTVRAKYQRIEELMRDIAERDAHWQSMIDSKNELIEELRERARN